MPAAYPLDSIAQYVAVDLGIGAIGTVVFKHGMPDKADTTHDTVVVLIDTGGSPPSLALQDDTDNISFQVLSRSPSAATAHANLMTVFQGLHGMFEKDVHQTHIKLIWATQGNPVGLGQDSRQRNLFSMSFRGMVRGVTR